MNLKARLQMPSDVTDLLSRLSSLRKDARNHFGGLSWTPITKQFGLYTANIPEKEAFLSFADYHFAELEKLFEACRDSQDARFKGQKTDGI